MATGTLSFRGDSTAVIFKAILDSTPTSPVRLNPDVPAELERIINRAVEKDRNLRYQHASEMRAEMQRLLRDSGSGHQPGASSDKVEVAAGAISQASATLSAPSSARISGGTTEPAGTASGAGAAVAPRGQWWKVAVPVAVVVAVLIAGGLYFRSAHAATLTEKDTVVLAEFANTTGDPVFDGTLKQALAVDLDQSPFLRVVPPARVQKTLAFMGRSPNERLTTDLARDLCQRVGSKAMLSGSIASLGTQYVLTLNAVNCQSGDTLAQQQAEASSKEQVLAALGSAAAKLRGTLGESLASVQKFDVPIEQVTTSSLDALKAFALGNAEFDRGSAIGSLAFYRRAVELDRNFAWVYARMGTVYSNSGELEKAKENIRKAYELRDRVSEREKLYISDHYYETVTGELDKEIETLELYQRTYPSDSIPGNNLGVTYEMVGENEKAAEAGRQSVLADPNSANGRGVLAYAYAALGRSDEARQTMEQALKDFPNSDDLHWAAFWLALSYKKPDEQQRQLAWARGKPDEFNFLDLQARALQSEGKLRASIELIQQAQEMEKNQSMQEVGRPAYLRGLAYLHAKQGPQAAAEFQKILDHIQSFGASPYVSLGQLGLARGLVLSGDSAKSRTAYQDFFTKWKDADPDIPILKEAKAEYARLQ